MFATQVTTLEIDSNNTLIEGLILQKPTTKECFTFEIHIFYRPI